jgi:oleate hydratase
MPRKSTTFLRRDYYDRPKVIPDGMRNMAMVGQFVVIPFEMSVSMDYCVRHADNRSSHGIRLKFQRV